MPLSYQHVPASPRRKLAAMGQSATNLSSAYEEAEVQLSASSAHSEPRSNGGTTPGPGPGPALSPGWSPRHANGTQSADLPMATGIPFGGTDDTNETTQLLDVDLEALKKDSFETGVNVSQTLGKGGYLFRLFSGETFTKDDLVEGWRKACTLWEQIWPKVFPVLAVLQWWFFNVLLVLLNKWIFQVYHFNFPLTLTAVHFAISFVGAYICIEVLQLKPLASVTSRDLVVRVLPMAVVTNLNVCLGNVSLRFIPVTFMQTVKAFTPAATVALQMIFLGKSFDNRIFIALLPVVGGVTLASTAELSFHMVGFLAALTSTIFTSANSILAEVLLKGRVDMDSINTVYFMAPQIFFMLMPLALFLESDDAVKWYYETSEHWPPFWAILVSGALAFGLNFSLFYAIQATSAMTFNVAGNLKVAVAMLLGWLIYRNPMSRYSTLGCVVTVAGCTWYGCIQYQVRQQQIEMVESHVSPKPTLQNLHSPRVGSRSRQSMEGKGENGESDRAGHPY